MTTVAAVLVAASVMAGAAEASQPVRTPDLPMISRDGGKTWTKATLYDLPQSKRANSVPMCPVGRPGGPRNANVHPMPGR